MEQEGNKKKVTAKWDSVAHRAWLDIVLEEIAAQNRPHGCLTKKGYGNLVSKFQERTGRPYSRAQHKNRWDALKAEYGAWKTLKIHASGLRMDPKTGTIAASEEWWKEKTEAMPACKKFRHAPLEYEHELDVIFDMSTCTNETARVPSVEDMVIPLDSVDENSPTPTPIGDKGPKKRVARESPTKKPLKNFRDKQFKRLVDAFVERARSRKSSVTSNATANDAVRAEISEMLDSVIEAGADEGSELHFYATQLLIKKEYRDVFSTLKKPEVKLAWLKFTWLEKKKA